MSLHNLYTIFQLWQEIKGKGKEKKTVLHVRTKQAY